MTIREFFEKYVALGYKVKATICEAEAGNELVSHDSYEEVIGEFQNYAEMDKHDDCEDYQYDLNVKAYNEAGSEIDFDTEGWHFLTAKEMLDKLNAL